MTTVIYKYSEQLKERSYVEKDIVKAKEKLSELEHQDSILTGRIRALKEKIDKGQFLL